MANITLTNLPTVTNLNGTEPLLGVQSNSSVQITTGQIVSLATGGGGISPLPVIAGGTGDKTLTAYGLLYGNGTAPIGSISPPAGTNYILVGSSGSAPTWQPTIPVTAGVDSINTGTTGLLVGNTSGQSPIGNTDVSGVVTLSGVLNAVNGGTGQSSYTVGDLLFASSTTALSKLADVATGSVLISGGVGVAPSYSSSPTISGTTTSSFFIANGTITGALSAGAYSYGTLPYTDTNIFASYQTSVNSYAQMAFHNSSAGAAASTDVIVGNNNTTATTYYGDFGMNSSGFTGTGSLNGANNVFLTSTTADLAIGTTTANAIRFVVNGAATDTITLPSTGNLFQADFTNATLTSRLAFQTSTSNSTTGIYALPNGTATAASWQATNAADPTNASKVLIATNGTTDVQLVSGRNGTGTYLPLSFFTNNSGQFAVNTSGAWGIGSVAASTVNYGTSGQVFTSNGSAAQPSWTSATSIAVTSINFGTTGLTPSTATQGAVTVAGTLVAANGGTGQSSYTVGDLLYASGTTALSKLADVATGSVLVSGGVGVVPSWSANPTVNSLLVGSIGVGTIVSSNANLYINANIGGGTTAYALNASGQVQSAVSVTAYYISTQSNLNASTNLQYVTHYSAYQGTISGTIAQSQIGFYADGGLTAGTTFNLGFQGALSVSGTKNWNLYMNGSAPNYLAGSLGVGTTTVGATAGSINAVGAITFQTTTNNQSYTTTGAGTITISSGTAGTIDNMAIGATTRSTGAFTTLGANGAVTIQTTTNNQSYTTTGAGTITISSGTAGTINNMSIGGTTAAAGTFTTTTATGAITFNTTTNNQSYTTTGAGTITITSGTLGAINNMTIGGTTAAAGTFTTTTSPTVAGGTTASSILTLESTSGAGTTDSIQFLTASQSEAARYDTTGAYFFKRVANAVNATTTLTTAQIRGGIITSTTAAAVTMTMPTGTVLDTAGTGLAATTLPTNATIQFTIKNTGATNAITVAVATGVTNGGVAADLTIAASATATYLLNKTATNTFVLYKQ